MRGAREGRRLGGRFNLNDCVFCARFGQPAALFETPSLYATPDKYPLTAGHVLVISREHLTCYGDGSEDVWRELEESAATVRRFLEDCYRQPVFTWENGVSGQSVFHAHLHLIPLPTERIHLDFTRDPAVRAVEGWDAIRRQYLRDGSYRYLEFDAHRYLLPGHSPLLREITHLIAASTGLRYGPNGWIKTTSPSDVEDTLRRWAEWMA